ncbi:conserved exported hypothetical protein [Burkholderiales bacterium 8X]|nr:conserved exported hypothetical protein [Burkholderiales bacterium 8X]
MTRAVLVPLLLVAAAITACGEKDAPAAASGAPAASANAAATSTPAAPNTPAAAPSSSPAPAAPSATAPAATPPAAATATAVAPPATAAAPKQVPLSVQGVANAGLTVRVKNIELGEDATILTVSASFGSRETNFTNLAETKTYLVDASGNQLMLRPPDDNRYMRIVSGDTMEGRLVFLGAVAPGTSQLRLVINEGNTPDNTAGPGLTIALPLQQGGT